MNTALILAAGVGQRMRNAGLPKQFLNIMGKPIIIYTIEKFEKCDDIDNIVIACHSGYVDKLKELISQYKIAKVSDVIVGGNDRQGSLLRGLEAVEKSQAEASGNGVVVIHDGVRPLVEIETITTNIYEASKYGCAMTVHPVRESVVITDCDEATIDDFKERAKTYSLTAPQSFRLDFIKEAFDLLKTDEYKGMPLLDAAMVYAKTKGAVRLVKQQNANIKITTPEDFYYLKAILELEEQKYIFGL